MSESAVVVDVMQYASQLGRLDFVSGLLASVTIIMAFGGIAAFLNIRGSSKRTAKKVAIKAAREEAERAANNYLQEHLPAMIAQYDDFIKNQIKASVADNIAGAQEEPTDDDH
jgi:hypothetical protein